MKGLQQLSSWCTSPTTSSPTSGPPPQDSAHQAATGRGWGCTRWATSTYLRTAVVLLLLGLARPGASQVAPWQAKFFEAPAVALPLLVAAAVQHSAELAALKTDQAIAHEDVQLARKAILSSVLLSNSYGYGNLANVTVGDQSLPATGTVTSQTRYATTLNLNLPLDRLLGRRNQISRQQLLGQKAEQLRQAREDAIRQQVIDLYQSVLLAHKVLGLRQQVYTTAQVNYQLAEKQFKAGELGLGEVSQLNDRYLTAAIEQETAVSRYQTAFMLLEDLAGGKVSDLLSAP